MELDDAQVGQLLWFVLLASVNMGVFAGFDARREGRSFLVWFLVGSLLAPFGILVWMFVRSNRPAGGGDGPPCGTCATPLRGEDRYCARCGAARDSTALTPQPSAQAAGFQQASPTGPARRYSVLTALSRAASRHPDVDLSDLVERARSARSASDFDAIEEELAVRAPSVTRTPQGDR